MNIKNCWSRKLIRNCGLIVLCLSVALFLIFMAAGDLRFNLTPSHPRGFYRLLPEIPRRSDFLFFCLAADNPWTDLASRRGYLGRGDCPSGLSPLLKRLAGLPGDRLDITPAGLVLNGRLLPGTERPMEDSRGRELPPSALRSGLIPAGLALVLSQEHPGSFDSRHFGLVPLADLKKARPVLTFD